MELRHVDPAGLDLSLARLRQLPEAAVKAKEASFRSKGQLSPQVAAQWREHQAKRRLANLETNIELMVDEYVYKHTEKWLKELFQRNTTAGRRAASPDKGTTDPSPDAFVLERFPDPAKWSVEPTFAVPGPEGGESPARRPEADGVQ